MGVQLAEVALEGRLADGEGPGLAGFLFIRTLDRHSYRDLAVRHIGSRGVGDLAVCVGRLDLRAVDSHRDAGVLASVRDLRGDLRPLFGSGLRTLRRLHVGDHSLVENVYGVGRSGLVALDILEREGQGHRAASLGRLSDVRIIDRDMDAALAGGEIARNLYVRVALKLADAGDVRSVSLLDTVLDPRIVDFIDCVDLEFKLVIAADIGREHGFGEGDGGLHDKAAVHIHAVRHGIEEEGVDGVIRDVVHAVGLECVSIILQPLAVAAVLRRAALHLIAAHAAGAFADEPVGVFSRNALFGEVLAVERVVAGAVGAEVAIRVALEAEVFAVLLDGEHNSAVRRGGLAVRDSGCRLFNGLGIVLRRQNRLCVLVVDHELVAGLGQIAGGLIGAAVRDRVECLLECICCSVLIIGAPCARICTPLNTIACTCSIVDVVKAIFALYFCDRPVRIYIVQRHTGEASTHGQLLSFAGRERICAIRVDASCPDISLCIAGQLAICQRYACALVVITGVFRRQGLHIRGIVDNILTAVLDRPVLNDIECLLKGSCCSILIIGAPCARICTPLNAVASAGSIINVIEAILALYFCDRPVRIYIVQRHTGEASTHGQLLAVLVRERVGAVRVDADRPDVGLGVAGQCAARQRHIRALVIVAGVFARQSLHIGRVVDDDLLAVLEQALNRFFGLDGVGEFHFVAVVHAVLRGLDGEGGVCIHLDGVGILGILTRGLVGNLRTLSLALELDLRSLCYFARSRGSSRGCDLLLGCGFNLVQRDRLLILRLVVTESGAVLCCIVVLQCCSVAGNDHLTAGKFNRIERLCGTTVQLVASGLTRNILSACRLDGVAASHRLNGKRIFRIITGDFAVGDRNIDLVPFNVKLVKGTVHNQFVTLGHDQVCTRPVRRRFCDLGVGLRLRCLLRHSGRHDRKDHDDGQQQRKTSRDTFFHACISS